MTAAFEQPSARRRAARRSGVALVLVVALMGAAALMSYALLGNALLRAEASQNLVRATASDALAESGMNLALYYLQNPKKAPTLNSDNYWPGATGIVLSSSVKGTVDVTTARVSGSTFTVTSTGHALTGGSTGVSTRTLGATVKLNGTYSITQPMASAVNLTVVDKMTVTNVGSNAVVSSGVVTISPLGKVVGNVLAGSLVNQGGILNGLFTTNTTPTVVPAATQITDYRTYTYGGVTRSATKLSSATIGITLGPTASNPAGVYWTDVNTTFSSTGTINGTIILRNGATLSVPAGLKTITPATGFPALVIDGQLKMQGAALLTVNGLVYLRGGLVANNTTSGNSSSAVLTITGSIMFGEAGIDSTYHGTTTVLYNAAKVAIPDFSIPLMTPQNVKVLTWSPPS